MKYRGITVDLEQLKPWGVDEEKVRNLIDLADVLRKTPPPEFDMESFGSTNVNGITSSSDLYAKERDKLGEEHLEALANFKTVYGWQDSPQSFKFLGGLGMTAGHTCGAVACAVGTGAYFGIGKPEEYKDWATYSYATFVVHDAAWHFLFSDDWVKSDNTAKGAAARILFFLDGKDFLTNDEWDEEEASVDYSDEMVRKYGAYLNKKIRRKPEATA